MTVPNVIHFCFGLKADFGQRPFSFVHYLAVKTAFEINRPDAIYFHYQFEPTGLWWRLAKPYLFLVRTEAPTEIFGNPIYHYAHQSDVLRLNILKTYGGIYLDMDVVCLRSFRDLLSNEVVMAREGVDLGLCNAVILSEPDSEFIREWLDTYKTFSSKGRDKNWAKHSVLMPLQLAKANPTKIKILDEDAFFNPLYDRPEKLWSRNTIDFSNSYCLHLWETVWWRKHLMGLSPLRMRLSKNRFSELFSWAIKDLSLAYIVAGELSALVNNARWLANYARRASRKVIQIARGGFRLAVFYMFYYRRFKGIDRMTVLDIGGIGKNPIRWMPGWGGNLRVKTVNLFSEAEIIDDAKRLSTIEDQSVDGIYTSHLIEHLWWWESEEMLKTWFGKLKEGGRIEIRCPDMEWNFKKALTARKNTEMWEDLYLSSAFGAAVLPWSKHYNDPGQHHRNHFWEKRLYTELERAGFERIKRIRYFAEGLDFWTYDLRYTEEHGRHRVKDLVMEAYRPSRTSVNRNSANSSKDLSSVFSKIYRTKAWGDSPDKFFSGPGSNIEYCQDYIEFVKRFISEHSIKSIIDIGCGDFRISSQILSPETTYVGLDTVKELIDYNQDRFGTSKVSFKCQDATSGTLPNGELCLVRQVFQHLSNRDIASILSKIAAFKYVIVTEHFPNSLAMPNIDIDSGASIRHAKKSAVQIDKPPFNVSNVRLALSVVLNSGWGILNTYVVENSEHTTQNLKAR